MLLGCSRTVRLRVRRILSEILGTRNHGLDSRYSALRIGHKHAQISRSEATSTYNISNPPETLLKIANFSTSQHLPGFLHLEVR